MEQSLNKKKISIIIPCCNAEQYIDRCFDHLAGQTIGLSNMELIFVDDASTDSTLSKLMSYETMYPDNVIIIPFEENMGYGAARNAALSYATAPYIGYVDADGWTEATMFEKMLYNIEQYDCDFVECGWTLSSDEAHHFSVRRQYGAGLFNLNDSAVKEQFVGTHLGDTALWNKLFKRSFLQENDIFCPEELRYEDIFFCYMAFIHADNCYCMEDVLYHCHYTQESGSASKHCTSDMMSVSQGFLQTCRSLGTLYTNNRSCIDWMFLERYYVYDLWTMVKSDPEHAFACYQEMKATILSKVPGYKSLSFRRWESNSFDDIMLKLIDIDLDETAFTELCSRLLAKFKQGGNVTLPTSFEATNRYHAELAMPDINAQSSDDTVRPDGAIGVLFCKWNSVCDKGIEQALRRSDYYVETMQQYMENMIDDMNYYDALMKRLSSGDFDCVFTVDFLPIIAKCCNDIHIPYICWTIDNPVNELYSDAIHLPWNRLFYFDRSQYDKFAPRNPENSFYMPLACNHQGLNSITITDEDHRLYDCDISFVGSTYEERCEHNKMADILPPYIKGYTESLIHAQLNVYGYNFIEEALTEDICNEFAKHIGWLQNVTLYDGDVRTIVADSYIGRKCTEQDRLITLRNISEYYNIDLYTTSDVSQLPKVHARGSIDYDTIMPKIFKCSKINLNMTSRSIRTGIPLRIFDIMGAGGFLLTNYQSELPDFFEIGRDLAVYESQSDLLDQIEYYLSHDDIRRDMAENGQSKVAQYHSYDIMLEKIIHLALGND